MGACVGKPSKKNSAVKPSKSLEKPGSGRPAPPCAPVPTTSQTSEHPEPKACRLQELIEATDNFSAGRSIGRGSFGEIWKGKLSWAPSVGDSQGYNVAVKKLFQELDGEGHALWVREAQKLLTLGSQHPNIVDLLGYYYSDNLLVFPLYTKGSLLEALRGTLSVLTWKQRVNVALGSAKALQFLHSKGIVHRNVKPSNILLDAQYEAHLGDFGMAREGPDGTLSHQSTQMMGDLGYMDPEYYMTSRLTFRSDVYALGVVLVELLAGRNDVTRGLRDWAAGPHPAKLLKARIDKGLNQEYDKEQAYRMLVLAKDCLNQEGNKRPTMDVVVQRIEDLREGRGEPVPEDVLSLL